MNDSSRRDTARAPYHEQILELAQQRLPAERSATMQRFIEAYYRRMDPEDLADRRTDDLYGAALAHWNLARRRQRGQAIVRVCNPSVEEHGWMSTHTVIEVINDDMPFLVDSVTMEANRQGLTLHLIAHPVIRVRRDRDGLLIDLDNGRAGSTRTGGETETVEESFLHLEVDRLSERKSLAALEEGVRKVLADVRRAVTDWPQMRDRMQEVIEQAQAAPPPLPEAELSEGLAFLKWLGNNQFIFLGYRRQELTRDGNEDALRIEPGSGLGILRESEQQPAVAASFAALPPELRAYARRPELLLVTKSNSRSTVHRPGYLDHIAVKLFDAAGQVCGEHRFLGLFTSAAYSSKPSDIPMLRHKISRVLEKSGLALTGHAGKSFVNILETYPRDELFQIDEETLLTTATGILHLGDRQRLRLFIRRDPFERFLSCLIYAPRENYHTELRQRWQQILIEQLNGTTAEFNVFLSESVIARIHIIVRTTPGNIAPYDVATLERQLLLAARRWEDDLRDSLVASHGEAQGNHLFRQFCSAFPASYREDNPARLAVSDIGQIISLTDAQPVAVRLYRPPEANPDTLRFKLFHRGRGVMLSDSMPMLEHTGLLVVDERPHEIHPADMPAVWIHDFGLCSAQPGVELSPDVLGRAFEEAFLRVFSGSADSDAFNRLIVAAGMTIDDVNILRVYARYLHQTRFPLSSAFIATTLAGNPETARLLVALFKSRFDPGLGDDDSMLAQSHCAAIEAALESVENLSEDRALRQLFTLVLATLRTSFWRHDASGAARPYLALKFDPTKIPGLPEPVPAYEVYVHSPRFEGVHLRGSAVARGGLRWSDRPEDYRTEVLGLMKAQMVKNTVIVPAGSKGGFVLKRAPSPANREAWLAEGIACYKDYLRGLLDVTDNRVDGKIVPPPDTRGPALEDPYLVVAADKGTATFSDHANAVSEEYGFWLGDAFASGGSAGYDHKVMGITARGAWESVRRHFRELGVDIQTSAFTVVGIGDMSGDVFGNGMLLSEHIQLVAAFDHRHIFLDPNPDAATGFAERQRLFALPRSSWAEYDTRLLSKGGGIFPRAAKSIRLTEAVKSRLGITAATLTPTELIAEILKAPVDLLFNGGIGTYVKSSTEDNSDVGDRANDALRVDGQQLRAKVVGEGGNLGLTQLGRIEYARRGGRLFTDAIDNSAGVGTSDLEVNIKILLGVAISDGELTRKQRDTLLASMTDTVAEHVLRSNKQQTRILSLARRQSVAMLDSEQRMIRALEKSGDLSRALEFLPDDEEIAARRSRGSGLTQPEQAVLLAYCKNHIYDELLVSSLPDDAWIATSLSEYFPQQLHARFANCMPRHPLRREIVTTQLMNSMVNHVGYTFVHRLQEATGASTENIIRAWVLARESFGLDDLWASIETLGTTVDDDCQAECLTRIQMLGAHATAQLLRSPRLGEPLAPTISKLRKGVEDLFGGLVGLLDEKSAAEFTSDTKIWVTRGIPEDLARRICALRPMQAALDIIAIATASTADPEITARVHFAVANHLDMAWLGSRIEALPGNQHWRMLARNALLEDLAIVQRRIATQVLATDNGPGAEADSGLADADARVRRWLVDHDRIIGRGRQLLAELRTMGDIDESMLSLTIRELRHGAPG